MNSLETDRLLLRRQHPRDAVVFHRLWTERDDRVPAHRKIDADGHPSVADITAHIEEDIEATGPRLLTVEEKATGNVVGYCGLIFGDSNSSTEEKPSDEPELAFELLQASHNQGYATEAGIAVLTRAADAGYARVWAGVWEWNSASRRVLEKLGFVDSGIERPRSSHGRNLLTVKELSRDL